MQTVATPSGDSLFISSTAISAPHRRGRPRIHANDSAKTAAYRARVRQRRLESAPDDGVKHHRHCTLAKLGYCLCDLPMDKGMFLTDAPAGCGKLTSGGYDNEKVAQVSDAQVVKEIIGGRRAAPKGHGIGIEDKKWSDHETDETFVDKQKFPPEWKESEEQKALRHTNVVVTAPTCCQCGGPASTVHPDDKGKRLSEARFLCGNHGEPGIS